MVRRVTIASTVVTSSHGGSEDRLKGKYNENYRWLQYEDSAALTDCTAAKHKTELVHRQVSQKKTNSGCFFFLFESVWPHEKHLIFTPSSEEKNKTFMISAAAKQLLGPGPHILLYQRKDESLSKKREICASLCFVLKQSVLLLFTYHICLIYSTFGPFYPFLRYSLPPILILF